MRSSSPCRSWDYPMFWMPWPQRLSTCASHLLVASVVALGAIGCARLAPPVSVVTATIVDLRAEPKARPLTRARDLSQETQLLYGEQVRVIRTQGTWALIEALEQPEFTHHQRWQGYPGWVPRGAIGSPKKPPQPDGVITAKWATAWSAREGGDIVRRLPMGTQVSLTETTGHRWGIQLLDGALVWIPATQVRLRTHLEQLPGVERRQAIIDAAQALIGDPYVWGARSPFDQAMTSIVTGVDCSGLVSLAYRTAEVQIPRDAHEQYLRAHPVRSLEVADLVFLSAEDNPQKIVHVMLYAGDGWLIEGPGTGQVVRRIAVEDRLGRPLAELAPGDRVNRQTLAFGAYLP